LSRLCFSQCVIMLFLLSFTAGLSPSRTPSMGDNAAAMRPKQSMVRAPVTAARPAVAAVVPPPGADAAKAAWLAKQDVSGWSTNAGPVPAAVPMAAAPMAAAAAPPQRTPAAGRPEGAKYQYKAAWSKYASSAGNGEFAPRRGGSPLPAVRSMAAPVAAPMPVDLLAARPAAVAVPPPRPAAVALPTAEDAAKAAWLAKQDVSGWSTNAGPVPAAAPMAVPMAAAAAPPQRPPAAGRPEGVKYQYKAAWSKYASSSGNGEFAPRRGQ